MQVSDSATYRWALPPAGLQSAPEPFAQPAGQNLDNAATVAQQRPAPPAPHLPVLSMLDALLNAQSSGGHKMVLGPDGKPDMRATLLANLPQNGAPTGIPGEIGAVKVMSWSDDGSADPANIGGLTDDQVAQDLVQQAGSNGTLGYADLLRTMGVDTATDNGKTMAKDLKFVWDKLAHGQSAPLSASQVAEAVRAYRVTEGDEIAAGGAMWRG